MSPSITSFLPTDWQQAIPSLSQGKHLPILDTVAKQREKITIFPPDELIFNAFQLTPYADVRVVIVGQDPYHGPGQAHGLAFSVPQGITAPPSLRNIFKEITAEFPVSTKKDTMVQPLPASPETDLTRWAKQGVFLLNTTLTVEEKKPASHAKLGWQEITDDIIATLSREKENLVFLLWGTHAHAKTVLIDDNKHLLLQTTHPSPFSAHKGFLGCRHFLLANEWLQQKGHTPISWQT